MLDLLYIAIAIVFFVACMAFVLVCEKL